MTKILGQDRALDVLRGALRSGRFQHAWVFSGPRGVGKFTTAMETARVLLDPDADNAVDFPIQNPKSKIQNLIDSGTHADLHIIRKELALFSDSRELRNKKQSNIPIDLLRERVIGGMSGERQHDAPAYRKAAHNHGKVFIIDEAELLEPIAQNSLLKTLEEPPPETYFFLITSQPDDLLPTIRSRCQHVRFTSLDGKSMRAWFKGAEFKANSQELDWIEAFAEGSPGVAQLAADYGFQGWQSKLDPMLKSLEKGAFPAAMGETLAGFVQEFAEAWVKNHKNASKDAANKDGTRHVFSLLGSHARRKMHEMLDKSGAGEHADWPAVVDLLREAERNLDFNVNLKMLLENLVVQWARAMSGGAVVGNS